MNLQTLKKIHYTNKIEQIINQNELVLFCHYNNIKQITIFKKEIKKFLEKNPKENIEIKLIKNKITTKKLLTTKWKQLANLLTGPTLIIYSNNPTITYSFIENYKKLKKNNEKSFTILAAKLKNGLITATQFKIFSKINCKEQTYQNFVSILTPYIFNNTINQAQTKFTQISTSIANNLQQLSVNIKN